MRPGMLRHLRREALLLSYAIMVSDQLWCAMLGWQDSLDVTTILL
jgi:hypothetical protein